MGADIDWERVGAAVMPSSHSISFSLVRGAENIPSESIPSVLQSHSALLQSASERERESQRERETERERQSSRETEEDREREN